MLLTTLENQEVSSTDGQGLLGAIEREYTLCPKWGVVVASSPVAPGTVTFGEFEALLRAGELRRQGVRVRVPDQSFLVLAMLLEHPGELVAREDILKRLWPGDTFVTSERQIVGRG